MTPSHLVSMHFFFIIPCLMETNLKMKFIILFNMKIALWDEMLDVNV